MDGTRIRATPRDARLSSDPICRLFTFIYGLSPSIHSIWRGLTPSLGIIALI